jgi:hypothetical protein
MAITAFINLFLQSFYLIYIHMAEIVVEVVGRIVLELVGAAIVGAINSHSQERRANRSVSSAETRNRSKKSILSSQKQTHSLSTLPTVSIPPSRAVLLASSNITFGNDCERLVNIAFQTSQAFPTIINTYADASQYLRNELAKQHPDEYFHIIIGRNENFGFSVDDSQYFAEIEQKQYRVLIFTTKQNSQTKLNTHDANSQMSFVWK